MNAQQLEMKVLKAPAKTTALGYTGSYVDMQGLITERNLKFIWMVAPGTTAGTVTGSVQSASDTAGTGLTTRVTFTGGLTATGGTEETHANIGNHRYLRVLADVQTAKDMYIGCVVLGEARYRP